VDGKPIRNEDITEMQLIYATKVDGKYNLSVVSSNFYPVFPDEGVLKDEVAIIVESMQGKTENEIVKAISSYIAEVYGKPNPLNVRTWYEANF
jgi:hypothetical protein